MRKPQRADYGSERAYEEALQAYEFKREEAEDVRRQEREYKEATEGGE